MVTDEGGIERIFELAAGIYIRSRRAAERRLKERGLTYAQFGALSALRRGGPMGQSELARALETDTTTAMVLRSSLESKGLARRAADPKDGRIKVIALTPKGTRLAAAAAEDMDEPIAPARRLAAAAPPPSRARSPAGSST